MTPEQRKLARHALGLDRVPQSYRNRYITGGAKDAVSENWGIMVRKGWAIYERGVFSLTRTGAEMVLADGESLCPEIFAINKDTAARGR